MQTLHMINSPYINDKVRGGSAVDEALKDTKADEEALKRLFLQVLGREPTAAESTKALAALAEAKEPKDKKDAAQDILWALLTSREFYFNH